MYPLKTDHKKHIKSDTKKTLALLLYIRHYFVDFYLLKNFPKEWSYQNISLLKSEWNGQIPISLNAHYEIQIT